MPTVQNVKLANKIVVFKTVGSVTGNEKGEFVIEDDKVAAELVNVGFTILPEEKKKATPKPEDKLATPVKPEPKPEDKPEPKPEDKPEPKPEDSPKPSSNKEDKQ